MLFTDGGDTTGHVSLQAALDAESKASEQVLAVGLRSSDYDVATLEQIAPFGVLTATSGGWPRRRAR